MQAKLYVPIHRIYNFGCRVNEDIPRDDKDSKKWGLYPRHYNGYDMQYFLGTLEPVLENIQGLSYYYVFNMVRESIDPCTYSNSQFRPLEVTESTPLDIMKFMKSNVLPTIENASTSDEEEEDDEA